MTGWITSLALLLASVGVVYSAHWTHHVQLDANYSLFWTPGEQDITFEVQVRTLGYVGFGFSTNGQMPGADIVLGWVKDNQVFFQDRFADDRKEPKQDPSQDYELLLGYENGTHTVLRFRRRYDTCDDRDIRLTNDTIQVLWAYNEYDMTSGGGLSYHGKETRGSQSLYLVQKPVIDQRQNRETLLQWDIKNKEVLLPATDETLYWCKVFKLPTSIRQKHHMIKYEPLVANGNRGYVHHMNVYECSQHSGNAELEAYATEGRGQPCYDTDDTALAHCDTLVLSWNHGSEGFSYPPEAGYPLDPNHGATYYMLETHYYNYPEQESAITDSSGLRIYHTPTLRRHDAAVLSVGLDPNWRHIIPPGQMEVVSEGHCVSDCTRRTLPSQGVTIFSVIFHTHLIGKKVKLRQIRNGEELPPIAVDNNYDSGYQENRRLGTGAKVLPGDHLIAECVYNSEDRETITLGGKTTRQENCLVYGLYYPRVNLSLCRSLPSLPTVLHSLGIQELWPESNPVSIKSPPELADMTLERRLTTYDWENNFQSFQEATRMGSFKAICRLDRQRRVQGFDEGESFYPNIRKSYTEKDSCPNKRKKPRRKKKPGDGDQDNYEDIGENQISDKDNSYNNVGTLESSRLNYSEANQSSGLLLFLTWSAILFCR